MSRHTSPSPPTVIRHTAKITTQAAGSVRSDARRGRRLSTIHSPDVANFEDAPLRFAEPDRQPSRGRRLSATVIIDNPPCPTSGSSRRRSVVHESSAAQEASKSLRSGISREPTKIRASTPQSRSNSSSSHTINENDRAWIASYSSASRKSSPSHSSRESRTRSSSRASSPSISEREKSRPRSGSRRKSLLRRSSTSKHIATEDKESLLPTPPRSRRQSFRSRTPEMQIGEKMKRRVSMSTGKLNYSRLESPERDMEKRNSVFRTPLSVRSRSPTLGSSPASTVDRRAVVEDDDEDNPFRDPTPTEPLVVKEVARYEVHRPRSKSRDASVMKSYPSGDDEQGTGKLARLTRAFGSWSRARSVHGPGEGLLGRRRYSIIV